MLAETFHVDDVKAEQLPIRFNVAPTQPVYAVAESRRENGRRQLGTFRWGLVPSWAKDVRIGSKMINARAEGIATKSAYQKALSRRRCIIPADAFYEWRNKQPYVISRTDGGPLAFAGLWELWRSPDDPNGALLRTCAIITTAANADVEPIHGRMPVMLAPDTWDEWLDPANEDVGTLVRLLVPAPVGELHSWPVSTRVNKADNEGADLVAPVSV
jgi:putative SOS response-associated peptidase YedK